MDFWRRAEYSAGFKATWGIGGTMSDANQPLGSNPGGALEQRPAGNFTPVAFSGNGLEYFGIWIVNLLLSILTLGIYSAWAKVRTNRYFYSHLQVGGHPLRYLAGALQILIGRLIAAALFGGYIIVNLLSPAVGTLLAVLLMFIAPYLICLSMRFNLRMTAWRNVRFAFNGEYGGAFLAFIVCPFLTVFSLFLALPWALKKMDEFIYRNIRYGDRPFACNIRAGKYFAAAYGAGFFTLLMFVAVMIWVAMAGGFDPDPAAVDPAASAERAEGIGGIAGVLAFFAAYPFAAAFYTAIVRNHLFRSTFLPELADFESRVGILSLFWLLLSNAALLIITLGLALPWVRVRTARYYADATSARVSDGIEAVIAQMPPETSAIGEEVAGMFDVDVGLT